MPGQNQIRQDLALGVHDRGRGWQVMALVLAIAAAVLLLVFPVGSSETISTSGERMVESTTLLQTEGASVIVLLAMPVLLTLIPLVIPRSHRRAASVSCTVLLGVGVLLAVLSIGLFFVPALLVATVACFVSPGSGASRAS